LALAFSCAVATVVTCRMSAGLGKFQADAERKWVDAHTHEDCPALTGGCGGVMAGGCTS
jgi:hypothetical protein